MERRTGILLSHVIALITYIGLYILELDDVQQIVHCEQCIYAFLDSTKSVFIKGNIFVIFEPIVYLIGVLSLIGLPSQYWSVTNTVC